jgi:hypothetical protein
MWTERGGTGREGGVRNGCGVGGGVTVLYGPEVGGVEWGGEVLLPARMWSGRVKWWMRLNDVHSTVTLNFVGATN